jgi:hypothetical protein
MSDSCNQNPSLWANVPQHGFEDVDVVSVVTVVVLVETEL